MTLYVSKDYYQNTFNGNKIPDEEIEKNLKITQNKIDRININNCR